MPEDEWGFEMKLSPRQLQILSDYSDITDHTPDADGWAYLSELGYSAHGVKKMIGAGYMEPDGEFTGVDCDLRITARGLAKLNLA